MVGLKIALRSLLRRKSRAALIGALVIFGTVLLVAGTTITGSAASASRRSIIENFTGDFIVYAARSGEVPSPFSFNTPLPVVPDLPAVSAFLSSQPEVDAVVPFAQNYSLVTVSRNGASIDLPFIYYAVDPGTYSRTFRNVTMVEGDFLLSGPGILLSRHQQAHYLERYGVRLGVGDPVTVIGLGEGGGVNALRTTVRGIFEPLYYANVFDYINFMDATTYSQVYNFTGVASGSLPPALEKGLAAASESEDAVFALAGADTGRIDTSTLKSEAVSGYTMVAVRLKDHAAADEVRGRLAAKGFAVKTAGWDEASSFFARIASGIQAFIYFATGLIFLVVTFIFMNTLIISITERTAEIGTMRALGGERRFIRGLFLSETLLLNLSTALVGMAVSLALLLVLRRVGLPLPETVSVYLIGGGALPLTLSAGPFLVALGVVAAVSVLATLLPVRVATRITPLAAMSDR